MAGHVIRVEGLVKRFRRYARIRDRLKEFFLRKTRHTTFTALNNVSFTLPRGSILGIVGENGSGKSTLLKCIARVLLPDAGTIERNGKITGILELGTGFTPQLSGRQNIVFNGTYLHMTREQLRKREEAIIEFAELRDFIDEPLKNYSSGMTMRLAFAIAMHADPACFLIDEALSVGDTGFQQKCIARLKEFRAGGGSICFVSHDMNAVKLLCDEALVLNHGNTDYFGEPEEAINRYSALTASHGASGEATDLGYGNGLVRFTHVSITDGHGRPARMIRSGESLDICFRYTCTEACPHVTFGVMIRDRFGQDVFGTNGVLLGSVKDVCAAGEGCFHFPAMNLGPGIYTINLAAHQGTTHLETCYHWWDRASSFEVLQDADYLFGGHTRLAVTLSFSD
ncbi:MAG: ABC transporter ATP-binding protein [Desulfovibrionaceae bacterium]|nr:ABC transporter ATP-binding protein [Desulfovibrionaceae bacterium]